MSTSQAINNARFDEEAAGWDTNKKHLESVQKAFEAIKKYVPAFKNGSSKDLDVLEVGCGTGLLSFMLAPHVKSLVGVDTSDGMIAAFNAKLAALPDSPIPNLCSISHLVTSADDPKLQGAAAALATQRGEESHPPYRFDLIVSHLTLHHIPSMPNTSTILLNGLKHGGMVALTDYEDFGTDAIRFHPKDKRPGVERHGIKRDEVEQVLLGTGFNEVKVEEAFILRKEVAVEDGKPVQEMEFPFLICCGVKS